MSPINPYEAPQDAGESYPKSPSGSLPLAGRAGEGGEIRHLYIDQDQREFARRLHNESTAAEKLLRHFLRDGKVVDARHTAWLESRGIRMIRYRNQILDKNLGEVVEEIRRALIN